MGCTALDLWRAGVYRDTSRSSSIMEKDRKIAFWQHCLQALAVFLMIVYGIRMYYLLKRNNSIDVKLSMIASPEHIQVLLDLGCLGTLLGTYLMMRTVTIVVTTDAILQSVFDTADDKVKVQDEKVTE